MTTPDDDRTVLALHALPAPGGNALPLGTRLGEFEILSLLGEGGFGIVYLAYDSSLDRKVALKEYMPAAFASRAVTQVHIKSSQHEETFHAGLRSFVNEARILAQFDHPALIKVYRFWEANGTAYMVMPYYQGSTLKEVLQAGATAPDEAWLKTLLVPLLHTLALIHDQRCLHRDISPDNIMILEDGRPLLLDFGAARRTISGMQQAFTVFFKQGYAPVEQYADVPAMTQGPWTDLYALASVIHYAIDGKAPPPAIGRLMSDSYEPLAKRFALFYSSEFLQAVDLALSVRPEQRPQSAQAMLALLRVEGVQQGPAIQTPHTARDVAGPRSAYKIGGMIAAGLLAVVLIILALPDRSEPPAHTAPPVAAAPLQTQGGISPATDVVSAPAHAPPPVAAEPFDPLDALAEVVKGASAERTVSVTTAQSRLRIGRDALKFSVKASHAGYLYIHLIGTNKKDFWLLFPNAIDKNNRIAAGETIDLPRAGWRISAEGPPGDDELVVILSDVPRDFSAAGLVTGELFGEFPIAPAAALQNNYQGVTPLFAGTPVCAPARDCIGLYGASRFSIQEYR